MMLFDIIVLTMLGGLMLLPAGAGILGFIEQVINDENVKASAFD